SSGLRARGPVDCRWGAKVRAASDASASAGASSVRGRPWPERRGAGAWGAERRKAERRGARSCLPTEGVPTETPRAGKLRIERTFVSSIIGPPCLERRRGDRSPQTLDVVDGVFAPGRNREVSCYGNAPPFSS